MKFWKAGEPLIFDDTYEHEVCNLSEEHDRVVMVFDVWHPEVLPQEREAIEVLMRELEGQRKT